MTTTIMPFEQVAVRIQVDDSGAPWFCAADVCAALEIGTESTRRLDDDEKGLRSTQTPGGVQDLVHVSEAGVYALVLTSRKPEAKAFRRWVTHEVLPAIRRTGAYAINPAESFEAGVVRILTEAQVRLAAQAQRLAVAEPKAAALDEIAGLDGLHGLQEAAKLIGARPQKWIDSLKARGDLHYRGHHLVPSQAQIDAGRMALKVRVVDGKEYAQAFITAAGVAWFAARHQRETLAALAVPRLLA